MSNNGLRKPKSLRQLIAFCVLMEQGEGILGKAPSYVLEKWELATLHPSDLLPTMLDERNQAKYKRYLAYWGIK